MPFGQCEAREHVALAWLQSLPQNILLEGSLGSKGRGGEVGDWDGPVGLRVGLFVGGGYVGLPVGSTVYLQLVSLKQDCP
mmetsp:Transcript_18897/g.35173  ORF Transcript_18897/g.35173 Transcript_18897/m.35173 type:complete len:80 (+) Transcript_18897:475-714(+)